MQFCNAAVVTLALGTGACGGGGGGAPITLDGFVSRCAPDRTDIGEVVQDGLSSPHSLVAVGDHLYWATSDSIQQMPVSGGAAKTVVSGRAPITTLFVSADSLYWAEVGSIARATLDGGDITTLAQKVEASQLLIARDQLYWRSESPCSINKVNLAGGEPETIVAEPETTYLSLAADDMDLFWSTGRDVIQAPLANTAERTSLLVTTASQLEREGSYLYLGSSEHSAAVSRINLLDQTADTLLSLRPGRSTRFVVTGEEVFAAFEESDTCQAIVHSNLIPGEFTFEDIAIAPAMRISSLAVTDDYVWWTNEDSLRRAPR